MMRRFPLADFSIKCAAIFFWLAVVGVFLLSPKIAQLFKQKRSLTIFTWPMVLDAHYLSEFEEKTGVKLYFSYFESNEELYGKLKSMPDSGYDIIIANDYIISTLIKEKFIKKIDKINLHFLSRLVPNLLGNYYDLKNEYTLPYFWAPYGMGVNKIDFGDKPIDMTWDLVFKKGVSPSSICMSNAPRESIMLAAYYLFGKADNINDPEKLKAIKNLLIEQKSWVQVYSDARAGDLLLSNSTPVCAGLVSEILRVKKQDTRNVLDIIIPEGHTFFEIYNIAISADSSKDDLISEFLNYIYSEAVIAHHVQEFGSCSPVVDVPSADALVCDHNKNYIFFRPSISEKIIDDIWIDLMAY